MNQTQNNPRRHVVAGILIVVAAVILCLIVYREFDPDGNGQEENLSDVVSEETASNFYTSLAALDVGQDELASQLLRKTVTSEPREPALWANLGLAQLRLRDLENSGKSLQQALDLAKDSYEPALLQAEFLEHSGRIERAIEQYRKLHQLNPEDIAVTYSLVTLLGRIRSDEAESERLELLSDILERAPGNLKSRCEQARLAATLEKKDELRSALDALLSELESWPEIARQNLLRADEAARAGDFRQVALSLTFFNNVLKPHPRYQQSQEQLGIPSGGETIGSPLRRFLRLKLPSVEAAEADVELTFKFEGISETAARPDLVLAVELSGKRSSTLVSLAGNTLHVGESAALPFPASPTQAGSASLAVADLNFDFLQDLILLGSEGCRIFLGQEDGSFKPHEVELDEFKQPWRSVWVADIEADGDLDLLLSDHQSPLRGLRNNGDMTFTPLTDFIPATNVLDLKAADFDSDGDIDLATLDTSGTIAVWRNDRGGKYAGITSPADDSRLAIAAGDVDRDGNLDLVSLRASGEIRLATWNAEETWSESTLVTWSASDLPRKASTGNLFLAIEDIDNNGAVDLIAGRAWETVIWLRAADGSWTQLRETPAMRVTSIADVNGDGLLDLLGTTESAGSKALNQSRAGYAWYDMLPKANPRAGDQRINPFGIGGRVEIRAGNLVQTAVIRSPRVHFGLGRRQRANVARIVWPNGTPQAEFDLQARQEMVVEQRLKGSCPWVFAFDGREFRFVKDFIWRSPLGMMINAQETAGVTQTSDWIKIAGSQLKNVKDRYPLRITAELWETHFFDQIGLLAVDHPPGVEVFVDERFVPGENQDQRVIAATKPQPLVNPMNHRGRRMGDALRSIDGLYADDFALGDYQGVAEEHWIEFELPAEVSADRPVLIVGHGWIYPTNSSLNVAIGQRSDGRPFGLILEQQHPDGTWRTLRDRLGFPAGKNKDAVIELPPGALSVSRKLRLRTNMEVYWDALGWSYQLPDVEPEVKNLPLKVADLRFRGFSRMNPIDRRRPDTPLYEVESAQQRWADLEGFYTRFGDVRELLAGVDDRYVIMNAGDELVLEFDAGAEPSAGRMRDFVLVGDGWVKDGDFNTAFSRWVRPLPAHDDPDYAGPLLPLEQDPVYMKHSDDWRTYHTRYVTPRHFHRKLRTTGSQPGIKENQP